MIIRKAMSKLVCAMLILQQDKKYEIGEYVLEKSCSNDGCKIKCIVTKDSNPVFVFTADYIDSGYSDFFWRINIDDDSNFPSVDEGRRIISLIEDFIKNTRKANLDNSLAYSKMVDFLRAKY